MPLLHLKIAAYDVVHFDDAGGVDLYVGYIVNSKIRRFGGSTDPRGDLRNNNGVNGGVQHPVDQPLFDVDIPDGTWASMSLTLIESDQTTDKVRAAFAAATAPDFGAYNIGFSITFTDSFWKNVLGNLKNLAVGIFTGAINTDDDYGTFLIGAEAHADRIEMHLGPPAGPIIYGQTNVNGWSTTVRLGGDWQPVVTLIFNDYHPGPPHHDSGNEIGVGIWARAE